MLQVVERPVAVGNPEDNLKLYVWVGDRPFEDAGAVAVAQLVRVLGLVAVAFEVADAHADDLHVVAGGVHVPQAFAEDLADGVETRRPGQHVDGAGDALGIGTEQAGAAGVGDAADAVLAGRLEGVVGAHVVALQKFGPGTLAWIAAQVDDGIHVPGGCEHRVEVGQVADDGIFEIGHGNAVEAAQLVAVFKTAHHGGADVAGGAGDEHAHFCPPSGKLQALGYSSEEGRLRR